MTANGYAELLEQDVDKLTAVENDLFQSLATTPTGTEQWMKVNVRVDLPLSNNSV
jgi:hypothetical protein